MISKKRFLLFLTFFILLIAGNVNAKQITLTGDAGKAFNSKIITAWQKAGALVGWLAQGPRGGWYYLKTKPNGIDALPAFVLRKFKPGLLSNLPAPSVPFAIGMGNTQIDNKGLKELAKFNNLKSLDLSHTNVTDEGLMNLKVIASLRSLDLGASKVTDDGLKNLAKIHQLRKLYFGSTAVTDTGIKSLTKLKGINTLYLYNTKVTNAGLKELSQLKNLRMLQIMKTQVTKQGIAKLAKALPNLKILR